MKNSTIALNRKAKHSYNLGQKFEAGIVLQGWEVKSLRAGKVQIADSYVIIKHGEAWLVGSLITPLISASTHKKNNPAGSRKLLLHKKEIETLHGQTQQKGVSLIPTKLYWSKNKVKLEFCLATGKKMHDKRASDKENSWKREKQQLFKKSIR